MEQRYYSIRYKLFFLISMLALVNMLLITLIMLTHKPDLSVWSWIEILIIAFLLIFHLIFTATFFIILIKPVLMLAEACKALSRGQETSPLVVKQNDEIKIIATSINKMAEALEYNTSKIDELALIDQLTRLYKRNYLFTRIKAELNKIQRGAITTSSLSILLIHIDNFKHIDITYGNKAGDHVLQEVARRITENCRISDIVARYSGVNIAIVTMGIDPKGIEFFAEKIRKTIGKSVFTVSEKKKIKVTATIGVTRIEGTELQAINNIDTLFQKADEALFNAKASGKNRVYMQ